jgi:thioredoxin-like negative regulator of GroEL
MPTTPAVTADDFQACPVLVLHYWAEWNLHDRAMDKRVATLLEQYAGRVSFRSCDIDRVENLSYIRGIANIPALGCFIRGKWFKSILGLRPENELRSLFDSWIKAAGGPLR